MPFTGKIVDTLRLTDIGARHRYVILTEPNSDGNVVILNFTTSKHFEWLVTFRPIDNKKLFSVKCTPNFTDARIYPLKSLLKYCKTSSQGICILPPKYYGENSNGSISIKTYPARNSRGIGDSISS